MKTAKEYVELINNKYKEAVDKQWSRYSPEWGEWSAPMNRELRAHKIKHADKVFQIWTCVSNLLELEPFNVKRRIEMETETCNQLSKDILEEAE